MTSNPVLDALRPATKTNVMTLLERAGHDVAYWGLDANGLPIQTPPAANPAHCYDWSFGSPSEGIVLCVWHASLGLTDDGKIVHSENMRTLAERLDSVASDRTRTTSDKTRARQQAARARQFDALVKDALARLLPLQLVINDGNQADREQLGAGSSEVAFRALDAVPWYVHKYDERSGQYVIVRDVVPGRDVGGDESSSEYLGPPDERQLVAIRVRRGQRDFRERLLSAWGSKCVVTGCRIVDLLEAAHIVPHAEVADYRTSNGLLLRADVHTLFDLRLLSIDEYMRVHLTDDLLASEYRLLSGKRIDRLPDKSADVPSVDALRKRHQEFVARR
jgi:hypothetical protein